MNNHKDLLSPNQIDFPTLSYVARRLFTDKW